MAASSVQNPPALAESKSSKKKKAKAGERTESPAPTASPAPEKATDAPEDSSESSYVREIQKNIRNINKKITNASKTDSLIAEHAGKSLDDLVSQKIINADQKAQILKKPALQAQLAQLEEQLANYKKLEGDLLARASADKAELEKAFADRLEKEKAEAVSEVKAKADADFKSALDSKLLVLSQFLRLAAARRTEDADPTLDENLALEGVLLAIYNGDESAVATMLKLVDGSEEKTLNVSGEQLQTTFSQVKAAAESYKTPLYSAPETVQATETAAAETVATDPTVAHATLSELNAGDIVLSNGNHPTSAAPAAGVPANALASTGAANEAAEAQWDQSNDMSMSISQEWVDVSVPREPAETETPAAAPPATLTSTQSWADDQPDIQPTALPADPNDGFHQVQRNRGRDDRERGNRGRGRGGEWRGRGGYRGEGRGRGRGGQRGGMAVRGPRRNEES